MKRDFVRGFKKDAKYLQKALRDQPVLQNYIKRIVSEKYWRTRMEITDEFLEEAGNQFGKINLNLDEIVKNIESASGLCFKDNPAKKYNSKTIGMVLDTNQPIRSTYKTESKEIPNIVEDMFVKLALQYGLEDELENANLYSETTDTIFLQNPTDLQKAFNLYQLLSFSLLQRARGVNEEQHKRIEEIGIDGTLGDFVIWLDNVGQDALTVKPVAFSQQVEIEDILIKNYDISLENAERLNELLCNVVVGSTVQPSTNKTYLVCKKMGYDYEKVKEFADWRKRITSPAKDLMTNILVLRSLEEKNDLLSKVLSFVQKTYLYSKIDDKDAFKRYDRLCNIKDRVFAATIISSDSLLNTYKIEEKIRNMYSNEPRDIQDQMVNLALFG